MATAPEDKPANQCENCGVASEVLTESDAKFFRTNRVGRANGTLNICPLCKKCCDARKKATSDIVTSVAQKKVIVAGPGTGKSFTFASLLQQSSNEKPSLVFTLINNLVDELERDLEQIGNDQIKVNTLHGYCKENLHKHIRFDDITAEFEYFPALPLLIEADADFLSKGFTQSDFSRDFAYLNEDSETLKYYKHQSGYYNAVSHNDSVYRVFNFYRANPKNIPSYEIVIVDEYQDFNLLEASFIQRLAAGNDVVIAGDDDQSLYRFRHASNKFIRELWKQDDFENFSLPYCSRCPPVLVEATNEFIKNVQKRGLLQERIDRAFECYWPDKHAEHNAYPKILVADCSTLKTSCEFVAQRILEIAKNEELKGNEKDIQFIVIGPESGYHIKKVQECLSIRLNPKVFELEFSERKNR